MKKLKYQNKLPDSLSDKMIAYLDAKFNLCWDEDTKTGCWIWNKSSSYSYGMMYLNGYGTIPAHRYSAFRFVDNPKSLDTVMHSCDNPACVNPKHLKWGTQTDNARDMITKGRAKFKKFIGSEHGMSKLTEKDVVDILHHLSSGKQPSEICGVYGVSDTCIYNIKMGRAWRHVPR